MRNEALERNKNYSTCSRTCIVDTPYALSLYLLKTDLEEYSKTAFYLDKNMPHQIADNLVNARRMLIKTSTIASRIKAIYLRLKCFLEHFLTVRHTEIFAQDHISCAARLIGRCNYTLIEDSPGAFHRVSSPGYLSDAMPSQMISRIRLRIFGGPISGRVCGTNNQCMNRWVSQPSDKTAPALIGRKFELIDIKKLWQSSSQRKQAEILRILCNGRDPRQEPGAECQTLILTQPLMDDYALSEIEMRDVYAPFVERYSREGVAIKPHPRDNFPFQKHFPQAKIIDTLLPMQLLSCLGMSFKRVVTISSSAVRSMSPEIEVVYIDVEDNPKISLMKELR